MAPTKNPKLAAGTPFSPIDLTSVAPGRITKPKATPKTKRTKSIPNNTDKDDATPGTPTKRFPSCAACRRLKTRCDRIFACEKCNKAGVDCPDAGQETGSGMGANKAKPNAACERCKTRKMKCVRVDTCVKCKQRRVECVMA
ncbi:hypothetical protein N0V88_007122 [Collariella sp. IMI 366227]|nr:hypothetical protein N0V88_007122 [Collariella sp. IMI 366227]